MKPQDIIVSFVLEESQQKPVRDRVVLYRALAEICGDNEEAKALVQIANKFSAADLQYREFDFNFAAKKAGQLKLDI